MKQFKFILTILCTLLMIPAFGQLKVVTSGNVGIGTETAPSPLTVKKAGIKAVANVSGDNGSVRLELNNDNSSANVGLQFLASGAKKWSAATFNSNGGEVDFIFYNDGTGKTGFTVDGDTREAKFNGPVRAQGILLTSDARSKREITNYDNSLDKVLKLNPVKFKYKDSRDNRTFLGVLAQDLQKIDPSLVSTSINYELDEDLNPTGVTTEELQIQADAIQYMLVGAIKDQQAIIQAQEKRIADLEKAIRSIPTKTGTIKKN